MIIQRHIRIWCPIDHEFIGKSVQFVKWATTPRRSGFTPSRKLNQCEFADWGCERFACCLSCSVWRIECVYGGETHEVFQISYCSWNHSSRLKCPYTSMGEEAISRACRSASLCCTCMSMELKARSAKEHYVHRSPWTVICRFLFHISISQKRRQEEPARSWICGCYKGSPVQHATGRAKNRGTCAWMP